MNPASMKKLVCSPAHGPDWCILARSSHKEEKGQKATTATESQHAKNNSCVDLSCLAILLDRQGTGAAVPWHFCLAHAMLSQRTTLIRDSCMECKTPRLLLGAPCGSLILGVCRVCKRASPRGGFDGAQKVTSQSVSCTPLELWLRQM